MAFITHFFLAFFIFFFSVFAAYGAEKITVQMRWLHQYQFAGYYAAIEKGYYSDAGLDVSLLEGGVSVNTVKQVVAGAAHYGVTNAELLLHRAKGSPVVALAAIFQHSPHVFLTRRETGIKNPQDFIGKKVRMSRKSRDIELHATLRKEGVKLNKLTILEQQATPSDYLDSGVDVVAAYITDQSYYLEKAGIPYSVIAPSTYGVDFYGDTLFTTQSEIASHPDRVNAFLAASLRGWEYAMAHPEEIADILLTKYGCTKSRDHLLSEAAEMQKLILPAMIELGHMNAGRWQHIGEIFTENGFLEPGYSLDGFLYSPRQGLNSSKVYRIGFILLLSIFGIGSLTILLLVFNRRMQREISERQITEDALRKSQQQLLSYAQQTEQFSLSAASILSIKDERVLFSKISDAIVQYSDYSRVLISLFHDSPPYRELIGYAGVSAEIVEKVKKTELKKSWYDRVFEHGILLGQFSYYIPHTMKHILNQDATIYGEGEIPDSSDCWHPEDNLFVRMRGEDDEFIGVISVDSSKSGAKPTDEIVRALEVYASQISQIIILKRNVHQREHLENQLRQAQKMEAIGNLTGGIAHDFNNILGVIIGNVELTMDTTPANSESLIYLEEISKASHRAKDIVRHLLTFSRKTQKELKPVKIGITLEDSISFLRSSIPSTIKIISKINLEGYTILADATQIYQIILNLCTNAVHAMEAKGGTLSIIAGIEEMQQTFHDISLKELPPGQYVKISIQDTGHGIDQTFIHQVFDPYFTTKDIGKGTGMGLSIVHGIVQSHNGAIKVSSGTGEGSTFTVYLPLYASDYQEEISQVMDIPGGTERILLVDDDISLLTINKRHLRQLGYTVEAFNNPIEAHTAFLEEPEKYDLVVTDMTMPLMTGEELAKKILTLRPEVPVFLCTGFSSRIDETSARETGIRKYFEKPLAFSSFAHAIRQELQSNRNTVRGTSLPAIHRTNA